MLLKSLFIVIEGVDGSGKTSVGKILAERLRAVYYKTPSGLWQKYRRIVENKNPLLRFTYYLFATICSSFEISGILKKKSVVCDRYIYSTWCHHFVYGCRFLKLMPVHSFPVKKPDLIFYLSVSDNERERRISMRKGNTEKDKDSLTLMEIQKNFSKISNMKKIDTTNCKVSEVVEKIYSEVLNY